MSVEPIKLISAELERKLTEAKEQRLTGTVIVELSLRQGGIGTACINTHTKESLKVDRQ